MTELSTHSDNLYVLQDFFKLYHIRSNITVDLLKEGKGTLMKVILTILQVPQFTIDCYNGRHF